MSHYPAPFDICAVMRAHEDAFTAFYLTESFLYRIVPVFAISALNIFIIVRLWRITRDRKRLLAATSRSTGPTQTTASTTINSSHKPVPKVEIKELKTSKDEHRPTKLLGASAAKASRDLARVV